MDGKKTGVWSEPGFFLIARHDLQPRPEILDAVKMQQEFYLGLRPEILDAVKMQSTSFPFLIRSNANSFWGIRTLFTTLRNLKYQFNFAIFGSETLDKNGFRIPKVLVKIYYEITPKKNLKFLGN